MPPGWPPPDPTQPPGYVPEPEWEGDAIDEASKESFPASDPPAFTQHRVIGTSEDRLPDAVERRRLRRWLVGIGIGLGGAAASLLTIRAIRSRGRR